MRKWAYRQKNMYWRNLASGALELEDAIDYSKFFRFAPPDLLKIFPPAKVIDAMRVRLDADKAADIHQRRHLPAPGRPDHPRRRPPSRRHHHHRQHRHRPRLLTHFDPPSKDPIKLIVRSPAPTGVGGNGSPRGSPPASTSQHSGGLTGFGT